MKSNLKYRTKDSKKSKENEDICEMLYFMGDFFSQIM